MPLLSWHDGTSSSEGDPLVLLSSTQRYAKEEEQFHKAARRMRFTLVQLPDEALHAQFRGNTISQMFELRWRGDPPAPVPAPAAAPAPDRELPGAEEEAAGMSHES